MSADCLRKKTEITLFKKKKKKKNVEHAWSDKYNVINIHLNEFGIDKLTPSIFSHSIVDDIQDPRTSLVNLAQINMRITDRYNTCYILLLKKELKPKERNRF